MTTAPYTVEELAISLAAIGGFESRPLVAIGVSGGPDSMTLMLLADRWARQRGGTAWGLIVDHGLRPESADEAQTVAAWLAHRDIPHIVLTWTGDKPATGLQEAARAARYALLGKWCVAQGCLHLLTAHHREDQIETHLIRRRAGSGPDGLAGMAVIRETTGYRLIRPLLDVPKERLRAFLDSIGQEFLSDPSNRNPRFERARLRSAPLPEGVAQEAASAGIQRLGRDRANRETGLATLLARAVTIHPAGFAVIDPAMLGAEEDERAQALLARTAATIGLSPYPLRRDRVARLHAELAANPGRARTLGGCRFVPWQGRILVIRELAAAAAAMRLVPGTRVVWDDRFVVELPAQAPGDLSITYLGIAGVAELDRTVRQASALPPVIHPVLPTLRDGTGLYAVPQLGFWRGKSAGGIAIRFRPTKRLTQAPFAVV